MSLYDLGHYSTLRKAKKRIGILKRQFRKGSGQAGFLLSILYSEDNTILPHQVGAAIGVSNEKAKDYCTRTYHLLKREADAGNGESMHLLAIYYQAGLPPVSRDLSLFKYWTDKAAESGCIVVEDLRAIYANPRSEFYDPYKGKGVTH